jgi:hypothetical protein
MPNVGLFSFPRHRDGIDHIRRLQPSVVKAFAGVTSNDWWRAVREASPGSIRVLVYGEVSDSQDMSGPVADADATARYLDGKPDVPRLVIAKNEPSIWDGVNKRKVVAAYTVAWLGRLHQLGINGVVGEFNSGWPRCSILDGEDWWPEFASIDSAMDTGDYWGLHEYWGKAGPLAWWPWTCGRHLRCPTAHNILIDECGFDGNTDGLGHNQGWGNTLDADTYMRQIIDFHRLLNGDPRVKGTSLFVCDYDNREWADFDVWPLMDRLIERRGECATTHPSAVMPTKLHQPLETYVYISQTFAEHAASNVLGGWGLDFAALPGTDVLAAADGVVDKVLDEGTASYGRSITINHGWGLTRYGHLSAQVVTKGAVVTTGQHIGESGNTGHSTGPHLHFEIQPYNSRKWPYRVDPAPYLFGTGETDVTSTQLARAKTELNRVAFLDKVAKLHNLIWCGFEYAEDGQTVTLAQKAGTLDFYRVAVTTGQWTEQAARAVVPELVA